MTWRCKPVILSLFGRPSYRGRSEPLSAILLNDTQHFGTVQNKRMFWCYLFRTECKCYHQFRKIIWMKFKIWHCITSSTPALYVSRFLAHRPFSCWFYPQKHCWGEVTVSHLFGTWMAPNMSWLQGDLATAVYTDRGPRREPVSAFTFENFIDGSISPECSTLEWRPENIRIAVFCSVNKKLLPSRHTLVKAPMMNWWSIEYWLPLKCLKRPPSGMCFWLART